MTPAAIARINWDAIPFAYASVDWGFTNPGTIQVWLLDYDGRMYLVHEVYKSKRLIGWWVDKAKSLHETYRIREFVADPSEPAYIRQFRDAGLGVREAINDTEPGIQAVQQRLAPAEDGRPRLYILRDCLEERDAILSEAKKPCSVVEEIDGYIWDPSAVKDRAAKEVPLKKDDHGADAMRYAAMAADRWYTGFEAPHVRQARESAEAAQREAEWRDPMAEHWWQ